MSIEAEKQVRCLGRLGASSGRWPAAAAGQRKHCRQPALLHPDESPAPPPALHPATPYVQAALAMMDNLAADPALPYDIASALQRARHYTRAVIATGAFFVPGVFTNTSISIAAAVQQRNLSQLLEEKERLKTMARITGSALRRHFSVRARVRAGASWLAMAQLGMGRRGTRCRGLLTLTRCPPSPLRTPPSSPFLPRRTATRAPPGPNTPSSTPSPSCS